MPNTKSLTLTKILTIYVNKRKYPKYIQQP